MSKKTNRRIDHKRIRQAERQALDGGHPRLIRSWSGWGPKLEQPMAEAETPHRKKRQHERKSKERCPVNGVHRFLKETTIDEGYYYRYKITYKLCVHCGKEETTKKIVGKRRFRAY